MTFTPRHCATCSTGTAETHRLRCLACLHPDVPVPPCQVCGSADYFMTGYCRRCHPRLENPDSCRACLAWGTKRLRGLCNACYQFDQKYPTGQCAVCNRELPLLSGYCRLCRHQARLASRHDGTAMDPTVAAREAWQLFLADIPYWPDTPKPGKTPVPGPFRPPRFIQPVLIDAPRDMSRARAGDTTPLDASFSTHVITAARRISTERAWPDWTWTALSWSLNLLTAVHGPDEKIKASTVLTFGDGHEIGRVLEVLAELDILLDDRPDVLGDWIDKRLADIGTVIRAETHTWIDILRHGGQRRTPRKENTIRQKIDAIAPFLTDMSAGHTTLREITTADIRAWLRGRPTLHGDASAIRDLFKTLAAARIIFGNPARTLHTGRRDGTTPMPLAPSDLHAIGAAAENNPALKVFVALIGVHALYPMQARELTLDAIDLHRNRLILSGSQRPLDDYTRAAITDYLRLRRARWPRTHSPYLLVSRRTGHTGNPVTNTWMHHQFRGLSVTAAQLRDDRLLEEATHNGDPLHLSAVFDITPNTSLRFVKALYGEVGFAMQT